MAVRQPTSFPWLLGRDEMSAVSDSGFNGRIRVVVNGDRVNLELIS